MGSEQTITLKLLSETTGIQKRILARRANKGNWPYVTSQGKGGEQRDYIIHSLPAEFQNIFIEKHRSEHLIDNKSENLPEPTPAAPPPALIKQSPHVNLQEIINPNSGSNDLTATTPAAALLSLPESCRNKGYDILLIVNRVRNLLAETPWKEKTPAIEAYAKSIGYNHRSLYRYLKKADKAVKAAQKSGQDTIMAQIRVLAPQWGQNKGKVRAFDKNAVVYALARYASPEQRNKTEVYEQTCAMAQAENWKIGSYPSMLRYLRLMDPATATLGRLGKKAFEADNLIKILRNYEEIPPLFMLCGDHHIFDVFVKLPDGKGGWNFKRPWVTLWMDMRSRSFMGWCISFAPNSRTIAMALAHAILPKNDPAFPQYGIPSSVYVDNGKDYRAKYLGGEEIPIGKIDYPDIIERFAALGIDPFYIDLEFDPEQNAWAKKHGDKFHEVKGVRVGGVYARLGIGQRYATAYHPWAKPIERAFRTVVQSFARELPGWCGSGHEQRPEKLTFELKRVHTILTLDEFCSRFYDWVVNKYHKSPHRGHGMNGLTPDEVFTSLMPTPTSCEPALLDFALMKKENVKIYSWGFNLNSRQFELDLPVNLRGGQILNILIGTWATIFFDYDCKTVRVYRDGKYICNARPLVRASFVTPNDPTMVDKLKLASYQKRAAAGQITLLQEAAATGDMGSEAAALLALTQGDCAAMPEQRGETTEMAGDDEPSEGAALTAPGEAVAPPAATPPPSLDPLDEVIFITPNDRYRGQIIPKLARGRELTPAQQTFRETFEQSQMYLESKQLYDAQLDYEKYLAGAKS